jgi:VWFA-related protein
MSIRSIGGGAGAAAAMFIVGWTGVQYAQAPQTTPPTFTATTEYVQVDARVVDGNRAPVRGLTRRDFQITENGVPQDVVVFAAVDLPVPSEAGPGSGTPQPIDAVTSDVSTNARRRDAQRIYLILLDDLFIDPSRTMITRRFLRTFIERSVGPSDLVAITSTGDGAAFENFTSDKARLSGAVDRFLGNKALSPTVVRNLDLAARSAVLHGTSGNLPEERLTTGPTTRGENPEGRRMQQRLLRLIGAMSGIEGGSKAIVLVSEGLPFERVTDTQGLTLDFELQAVSEMARRNNVPVYPVDPRGLATAMEDAVLLGRTDIKDTPTANIQREMDEAQRRLRALADDTGGFAVVSNNDLAAGLDRVVMHSSSYYTLGYYPKDPRHDGRFRKIDVKVDRPGVTVLSRRGYTAPPAREPKKLQAPGPAGTSDQVREALNATLPDSGLTLSTAAAAFREPGGKNASVAVVLEGTGADLELAERNGQFTGALDLLSVALEPAGGIKASDVSHLQLSLPPNTADRLRRDGFRWLSRLNNLKPGRYQVRAVAASGSARRGSVWHDLLIPDFSEGPLAMSDVMLAAASAFQTPTLKPDKLMGDALPGPATAVRQFPSGDSLAVFAEVYDNQLDQPHELDTSVVVTTDRGAEVFRSAETRSSRQLGDSNGTYRSRTVVSLANFAPGRYVIAVEARRHENAGVSVYRTVPFRVVPPGTNTR